MTAFEAIVAAGVPRSAVSSYTSEAECVEAALSACERGDLLLVFGDDYTRCWKQIIYFGNTRASDAPAPAPAAPLTHVEAAPEEPMPANLTRDSRGVFPEVAD